MAKSLDIDVDALFFIQYVYEFTAFCTSSVVKMANGTIVHDRNLDFAFPDVMRKITFEGKFYQGDKYLFTGVMFAGYNGVLTGFKGGAFSISINERKPSWRTDPFGLVMNFAFLFAGATQPSKLIRDTLTNCGDYSCAYNQLTTVTVISPCYLIVAGTKDYEGAVITRDRTSIANLNQLSESNWYVL